MINPAKKIIKENGFYPNIATFGSLANRIALARKHREALFLWNEVKKRCEVWCGRKEVRLLILLQIFHIEA